MFEVRPEKNIFLKCSTDYSECGDQPSVDGLGYAAFR
jgi:hypothetical protein